MRDPNYTWASKKLMKENDKIKVGVIGASGFTGQVLMGLTFWTPFRRSFNLIFSFEQDTGLN